MLAQEEIVAIDVQVGDGTEGISARLIVPRRTAHVAYGGLKLFKPTVTDNPTYQVVMFFDEEHENNRSRLLPQKDISIRLAHASDGRMVKIVRNSNYFGEWKKGVFAGEDYRAKLKGNAIFLHAGCRKDTLENRHGKYVTTHSLFVALSPTAKRARPARCWRIKAASGPGSSRTTGARFVAAASSADSSRAACLSRPTT